MPDKKRVLFPFEVLGCEWPKNHHHVPPKSKGGTKTILVDTIEHRAFHILFKNAGSLQECIDILRKEWWPE